MRVMILETKTSLKIHIGIIATIVILLLIVNEKKNDHSKAFEFYNKFSTIDIGSIKTESGTILSRDNFVKLDDNPILSTYKGELLNLELHGDFHRPSGVSFFINGCFYYFTLNDLTFPDALNIYNKIKVTDSLYEIKRNSD